MIEPVNQQNQDLILKLDAARSLEISVIRKDMESFLRGQLDLEHKMEIVSNNQNALKERIEQGMSKTLFSLDKKFDALLIEWGTKKAEDVQRDKEIAAAQAAAKNANKKFDTIIVSFAVSIIGGVGVVGLIWGISKLLGK